MTNKRYLYGFSYITGLCLILTSLILTTALAGQEDVALPESDTVTTVELSYRYAINLQSNLVPVKRSDLPSLNIYESYQLYSTLFNKDGKVWHRWRLGFFPTEKAAQKVLKSLRKTFRSAWITTVSMQEREQAARQAIEITPQPCTLLSKLVERLARLIEQNEQQMQKSAKMYKHTITTLFWVGEEANKDNNFISNTSSAWDEGWLEHYGGIDSPLHRCGYKPCAFKPKENPFYFALPYNDLNNNGISFGPITFVNSPIVQITQLHP